MVNMAIQVNVMKVNGKWEADVDEANKQAMWNRVNYYGGAPANGGQDRLKKIWKDKRRSIFGHREPHFLEGKHTPVVLKIAETTADTVTWVGSDSSVTIKVEVKPEGLLRDEADVPPDPFGWNGPRPQSGTAAQVTGTVQRLSGLIRQVYYKFTVTVFDAQGTELAKIDPDIICDL